MYCQKLIVNTLRHFRIVTRSSYAFANICSLNQRKNMFMTYLQQINKIKDNYSTNKRKNLSHTRDYIISEKGISKGRANATYCIATSTNFATL